MHFYVQKVAPCWYDDGVEGDERLWRLDFVVGENGYQAQVFCREAGGDARPDEYRAARLFIERDNRHPDGSGDRVDYACRDWNLTADEAVNLLIGTEIEAVYRMREFVWAVAALPCDHGWLDAYQSPEARNKRYAYWADGNRHRFGPPPEGGS